MCREEEWHTDQHIFEELYRRYYRPLFLYAFSLTHSETDAEDLTANTFVKALTTFRSGNIQAWMYTVLRNEFLDLKKRQQHETSMEDACIQNLPAENDVLQECIHSEERRWLYRQIHYLPEQEQEVILLTMQTEFSDSEIADILGLTTAHVRVLRHRAKKRLIAACEEEKI